ncbi:hypothetical protein BDP27DRAFT_1385738 [Rhodocollybia butyracea]|uniref:DUF6729 domain-containing protein n=1 Tax=Rhodocollybia butyracea TaxID=206335 RepID=A0A9P5PAK7_9AGAR|nr:hypothetical protein BDP27DRAFT_1385738 [Rhodocollybia butyracea]
MDDDEMPEDQIDSLMAEGISKDSLGEENSEEDRDEYDEEKNFDFEDPETSQVKPKKATNAKPYPSWFQDCLKELLWSVLQKPVLHPMDLFIPQFFLWDPDDLISIGISCPSCNQSLNRNGILPRPRRIVDIDCSFWIVGYSYCCRSCKKNYRSWDRRILAKLPPQLSAQFPAHLTWRSVLRSCLQNGMGAHQVAGMFRVQHLLRYDELRCQYLLTLMDRINMPGQVYEAFLPFEDGSDKGFHGFVPSGQWFRDVYDSLIESHKDSFNQHTAMLTARVCAIDHSHKLAKHIAKIDSVPIFIGLLTVTNDKGEIRVCNFVASKAHSQFTDVLKKVKASLDLYGHEQPQVFYTDNMSDKGMLEECFPSLLEDVIPVEKHSALPLFSIPTTITPIIGQQTASHQLPQQLR